MLRSNKEGTRPARWCGKGSCDLRYSDVRGYLVHPRQPWEDRGKAGWCIYLSQGITTKWASWRSRARTGNSHRLCGECCCSGEAAGGKAGTKAEWEDGWAPVENYLKSEFNSDKCLICDTCPWTFLYNMAASERDTDRM